MIEMEGATRNRQFRAGSSTGKRSSAAMRQKDDDTGCCCFKSRTCKFVFVFRTASLVLLSLVPVYIMSTGLPAALCNMLGSSWSSMFADPRGGDNLANADLKQQQTGQQSLDRMMSKRLNLFAMYIYFCFTVTLIHFSSFVQLGSIFKNTLALGFGLSFALIGYFGLCPNLNVLNQVRESIKCVEYY